MLKKKNISQNFKWLPLISALFLINGCDKQVKVEDGYTPEFAAIEAEEQGEQYLFQCGSSFDLSEATCVSIEDLLKSARAVEVENVEFMIISNAPVLLAVQKKVKSRIRSLMYKHGFIKSRIIDKGVCVYKDAQPGVRIGLLRYKVKEPNCNQWNEYIGDTDVSKNLPKYGVSAVYNLEEMIANKADFVSPRTYSGTRVDTALSGMGVTTSSGGGNGSAPSGSGSS
ncbi:MAG: hypothetical protein IJT36_09965 [Alphaproteobacteria bacterium]|nr:hypothetical protein [Alphaproteobacteria bacterium]